MNIGNNPVLCEKLAGEYVLGTLKGGARRRFETLMSLDARVRGAVADWQARLQPLEARVAALRETNESGALNIDAEIERLQH